MAITRGGNPAIQGLEAYVEQNKIGLIAKAVLGGNSLNYFNLQTNVLGPTTINLLNTNVVFQNGGQCGFEPQGNVVLSQRKIEPKILKVNMEFCDKNLLGTFAQYQVKIAAGKETLPFEEMFIGDVIKHVNDKLENILWSGNANTNGEFDGILMMCGNSGVKYLSYYKADTTLNDILVDMYLQAPEILKAKDDVAFFVSPQFYEAWVQELIKANLYHIFPGNPTDSMKLPGTNVDVIKTNGLNKDPGTNDNIVLCSKSNIYVGVDMENSKEVFDFWFSQDDRKFKLDIQFSYGVQFAFPDEILRAGIFEGSKPTE